MRGKTVYILVVDDDRFANALVQFVLSKEGYEVETTDNPRGAMHFLREVAHEPQAIATGNTELDSRDTINAEPRREPRGAQHAISIMRTLDRIEVRQEFSGIWIDAARLSNQGASC